MTDFRTVQGFEDVWRPPVTRRPRRPETVLGSRERPEPGIRARLARLVRRAPEVMVKVTGRVRDASHLRAHLDYISRNGDLDLETQDGDLVVGRREVREAADDWSVLALADTRRRATTPITVSLMLSMPAGTDASIVRDAARAFGRSALSPTFEYVFTLHTDAAHPHIHFSVRALGQGGERLNSKKADLESWRQIFARELRDRGVDAEATPRRARGVSRKAERQPIRKLRERFEAGRAQPSSVMRGAYAEGARAAVAQRPLPEPWEERLVARQRAIRGLYLAQARLLATSPEPDDRALGRALETFVAEMPAADTQRLALARQLRADVSRGSPPRRDAPDKTKSRR